MNLKTTHKPIKSYYNNLQKLDLFNETKEGAVSPAFATLLRHCAHKLKLTLIEQYTMKRNSHSIRVDGAVVDEFKLPHGYWEAKDSKDNLEKEVQKKFKVGYPKDNIIFQSPTQIIIYQHGQEVFNEDITEPNKKNLVAALKLFFAYEPPAYNQWERAIEEFKPIIPQLGEGLLKKIEHEYKANPQFKKAFTNFLELCRQSLNPNLSKQAVEEMLIQHLLTERLFRTVFANPDFARHNIIAAEIEKVIDTLTSHYFSRKEFLAKLDRFYGAIETTAATIDDYSQKQSFLNTIYEQFFQGFSVKVADTHGIVYTPQPIVDFMVNSVEDIMQKEFGRSLSSKDVHILDPFVGTGNFIINVMRKMKRTALPHKYAHELHCNEVMLLPYYIASMNIEHAYYELTDRYEPFEGICFVDTFELAEEKQRPLFVKANTERVERQKHSPIFVIIGNPPYNAGQVNENDNNKNRKYPVIDRRVSETYGKDSKATLLRKLSDPYVKAIRWASDRIGNEGIVALVTNGSFLEDLSFDGMRKHLAQDFDSIYILDLGGNVRKNPKLSGTTHNVFGIQVGVSINLFIRKSLLSKERQGVQNEDPSALRAPPLEREATLSAPLLKGGFRGDIPPFQGGIKGGSEPKRNCTIYYARVNEFWRKEQKYEFLEVTKDRSNIDWQEIAPDAKHNWLTEGMSEKFHSFIPMGTKEAKRANTYNTETIFKLYSTGVSTNRDAVVYDFNKEALIERVKHFAEDYNDEVYRYIQRKKPEDVDSFVSYKKIKWSRNLKRHLRNGDTFEYDAVNVRESLYRPFLRRYLYFSDIIVDELGYNQKIFPTPLAESENQVICVSGQGSFRPFHSWVTNRIASLDMLEKTQCFPFYIYDENGSNRRENITDWALERFRERYGANPSALRAPPLEREATLSAPLSKGGFREDSPPFQGGIKGGSNQEINYDAEELKKRGLSVGDFHLPYNPKLVPRAKELRKNMTKAERKLWYDYLRNFKYRVLRQRPIDNFIVDFYCPELKLVIEIDGETHFAEESKQYDEERTKVLEGYGLRVIRFLNTEVLKNLEGVSEVLDSVPLLKGGLRGDQISKWDIFHYIYGLLHHPEYRETYAANLKRELPRIPFAPDFWAFAKAGKRLADLHVNYEDQPEYELETIENPHAPLNLKVEKMKLSKDKTQLIYNDFLTLAGIPKEVYEYRLGNRSALEWIVDQYRVKTDKRSGIVSDPNRADDPEYIIRLIKKVITVSLETVKVINKLEKLKIQ